MRSILISAILLVATTPAAAQLNTGSMLPAAGFFEVPYTDVHEAIHVTVRLAGAPYPFIFDCGAPTFISTELQEQHHFPVLTYANVSDATGRITDSLAIVTIDTLRCGPLVFTGIPALVMDLGPMGARCSGIEGNMGSNVARFLTVEFDLAHHIVVFTSDQHLLRPLAHPYQPMRLSAQSDVFFPIILDGDLTDSAHFDSGSGDRCELATSTSIRFATAHPGEVAAHGKGITSYGSFGPGEATEQFIMAPRTLSFAAVPLKGVLCDVASNDVSRIGRGILEYGLLRIDYPNSRFVFEPFAKALASPRRDLGFQPVVSEGMVIAGTVWEGTEAERAGLRSGDRILRAGKVRVNELDECALEKALQAAFKADTVELEVAGADGVHRTMTLHQRTVGEK